MIYNKKTSGMDIKALLSTLWIFFLLNTIFRDIHEFFRPGLLEEMMTRAEPFEGVMSDGVMSEGFSFKLIP